MLASSLPLTFLPLCQALLLVGKKGLIPQAGGPKSWLRIRISRRAF